MTKFTTITPMLFLGFLLSIIFTLETVKAESNTLEVDFEKPALFLADMAEEANEEMEDVDEEESEAAEDEEQETYGNSNKNKKQ